MSPPPADDTWCDVSETRKCHLFCLSQGQECLEPRIIPFCVFFISFSLSLFIVYSSRHRSYPFPPYIDSLSPDRIYYESVRRDLFPVTPPSMSHSFLVATFLAPTSRGPVPVSSRTRSRDPDSCWTVSVDDRRENCEFNVGWKFFFRTD